MPEGGLELMAAPVRRRLFAYVAGQAGEVGRDEAARAVGASRSLAAFHLDKLVEAGLLEAVYRRPEGRGGPGAGRPAKLYRRTAAELALSVPPRRYELMAELLVKALAERPAEPVLARARSLARARGRELGGEAEPDPDERRRLLGLLAAQGFEPEADGPLIRLLNCPFHALAEVEGSAVCRTNLAFQRGILEGLRAGGLEAELDRRPGRCCVVFRPRP